MLAGGGAPAAGSACAVQPTNASSAAKQSTKKKRSRPAVRPNCRALLRFMSRMAVVSSPLSRRVLRLELDHDGHSQTGLILAQIRIPNSTVIHTGCRRQRSARRRVVHADKLAGLPVISTWRRDASPSSEVRHVRVAIPELPQKRDVLLGHVVEGN